MTFSVTLVVRVRNNDGVRTLLIVFIPVRFFMFIVIQVKTIASDLFNFNFLI